MVGLDIAALLADVSPGQPCGENLEYDLDFAALERAAKSVPEQVMGDAVVPAKDPDWRDVRSRALGLLVRSKDLRIAVVLVRSLLRIDGILGFCDGLQILCALVKDRWDAVHPRLDPDEAFDPTARVNALACLCDPDALLRDLRETPMVTSRAFGPVCWRDVAIVSGEVKPLGQDTTPRFDAASLNAAFRDADADQLRGVAIALAAANARSMALEQFLTEKVGTSHAIDFEPLTGLLGSMAKYLNQRLADRGLGEELAAGDPADGGGATAAAAAMAAATAAAGNGAGRLGEITGRDDVIRLLDRICAYYARCEPASPVPLLLERAKRLVPLGFAEIVRALAPDAMPSIEALRGPNSGNGSG